MMVESNKVKASYDLYIMINPYKVKSFVLGNVGYCKFFVKDHAFIVNLMGMLLKKDMTFK
jgi:hypothetical protein